MWSLKPCAQKKIKVVEMVFKGLLQPWELIWYLWGQFEVWEGLEEDKVL